MKKFALCLLACLAAASSAGVQAQLFRAYVSGSGNDANPCTLQAPCRLLPRALNVVQSSGEIWMLDSANYNTTTVTINQSVTILAVPGVVGSVVAVGGAAISITTSDIAVALRNLVIRPLNSAFGTRGVVVDTEWGTSRVMNLVIDGCDFSGFDDYAIYASGAVYLGVLNSVIRESVGGIQARSGARAAVSNVKAYGIETSTASAAFYVNTAVSGSETTMVVENSLAQHARTGFRVSNEGVATSGNGRMQITRSTSASSANGVVATNVNGTGVAAIVMDGMTIVDSKNESVIVGAGTIVYSRGNNSITFATAGVTGSLTPLGSI